MASWSRRRRFTYAGVFILAVAGLIGVPAFLLFYKAPSCSDGKKNGDEGGVDCGGSCSKLCPSAFLSPAVSWVRFEEVAPHIYNVAAYIVNPNFKVRAANTPYVMTIYDASGAPIAAVPGSVTIPAGRNTLAFKAAISMGSQTPARASLKFTGIPDWAYETTPALTLSVADQKYTESTSSSALTVTLANRGIQSLSDITVYAVLEDKDQNAIGFSKTILDSIPAQGTAVAPFTWPFGRGGRVVSIDVLPVAE